MKGCCFIVAAFFKSLIMKSYKVIALSVGGKSNKIFECGQVVNEDAFEEGHAEILTSKGFLEPVIAHVQESNDLNPDDDNAEPLTVGVSEGEGEKSVTKKGRPSKK